MRTDALIDKETYRGSIVTIQAYFVFIREVRYNKEYCNGFAQGVHRQHLCKHGD
jgi:hypothetical protein